MKFHLYVEGKVILEEKQKNRILWLNISLFITGYGPRAQLKGCEH